MEENPRLIKQTQQPSAHLPCACSGAPSCKAPFALLCVLNAKYVHAAPAPYCLAAGVSAFAPDISVAVCEVIDFGEYDNPAKNFSRNAAMTFAAGRHLEPAERLYLYLDHLNTRVAHG